MTIMSTTGEIIFLVFLIMICFGIKLMLDMVEGGVCLFADIIMCFCKRIRGFFTSSR